MFTITIEKEKIIDNQTSYIIKDNILYIFEKDPFIEYNIEDLELLEYTGKIKHKIGITICVL